MRLVRYGDVGREKPGLLDGKGVLRDLSAIIPDICGPTLDPRTLETLRAIDAPSLPEIPQPVRLGACVGASSKVIGVAINYRLHGVETGSKLPAEPTLFLKAPSSICGAYDDIELPRGSEKTDWEVELGVVIGTRDAEGHHRCVQGA